MSVQFDPKVLSPLAEVYERIAPLVDQEWDDLYLDGEIRVRSKDGFTLARFFMQDDWWMIEIGPSEGDTP